MKWKTEIRLRFRGMPFKMKVGFSFEWKAWLIAYDLLNIDPEGFQKLDPEKQMTAICYGAAVWDKMSNKKRVYFTYEDIVYALNKASKEENKRLAETLSYARFPEWLQKGMPDSDKKKATKK